jgi:hypothetical protein
MTPFDKNVVGGAPVRFVPLVGGFEAKADAEIQIRPQLDGVLDKAGDFKRSPAERCRARHDGERGHGVFE